MKKDLNDPKWKLLLTSYKQKPHSVKMSCRVAIPTLSTNLVKHTDQFCRSIHFSRAYNTLSTRSAKSSAVEGILPQPRRNGLEAGENHELHEEKFNFDTASSILMICDSTVIKMSRKKNTFSLELHIIFFATNYQQSLLILYDWQTLYLHKVNKTFKQRTNRKLLRVYNTYSLPSENILMEFMIIFSQDNINF